MNELKDIAISGQKVTIETKQHSIGKSIFLHLFPGIIFTLVYILFIPLVNSWGYPAPMASFLTCIVGLVIPQLGYVLYQAKKINGTYSLKGLFTYKNRSPIWHYLLITVGYIALSLIAFFILPQLYGEFLMNKVFFWLPEWFTSEGSSAFSISMIVVLIIVGVVSNIASAIVEEFYFRGVLLAKISRFGAWSVLINTTLFVLYHFDSLWKSPERFITLLPLIYIAWKKKDMLAIIIPHAVFNALGIILWAMTWTVK